MVSGLLFMFCLDFIMVAGFSQIKLAIGAVSRIKGQTNSITSNMTTNFTPEEIQYLTYSLVEQACSLDRGVQRRDMVREAHLSYCNRYKISYLLSRDVLDEIMHNTTEVCSSMLAEFTYLDEMIRLLDQLFKNILFRYHCHNGYSVHWGCEDCEQSYTDWICSRYLPVYMIGELVKPCISFCERVEQRCPYFHPITKEQYGGQPVFICQDLNVPFVPEITPNIPYRDPPMCYDLCHIRHNRSELLIDSLAKYELDFCPSERSIVEAIRRDPWYGKYADSQSDQPIRTNVKIDPNAPEPKFLYQIKFNELKSILAVYSMRPEDHPWHLRAVE